MRKVTFPFKGTLKTSDLNQRFADLASGSILQGFRLKKGTGFYSVSIARDGAAESILLTKKGVRLVDEGDAIDAIRISPNTSTQDRYDVVYVIHDPYDATFYYEAVEGISGESVKLIQNPELRTAIGHVRVRPNQTLTQADLTAYPLGLRIGTSLFEKVADFIEGIKTKTLEIDGKKAASEEFATSQATNKANTALTDAKAYADTQLNAAKTYTSTQLNALIGGAPGTLDTLKEIADALGNDAQLSSKVIETRTEVMNARGTFASLRERMDLQKYYVNVKEFGAKGDGVTDDTAAIQTAINSTATTGNVLFFPESIFAVSKLSFPANFKSYFSTTKFVRNGGTGTFISFGESNYSEGLIYVDGNKNILTGGKSERGVSFGSNCVFKGVLFSYNHNGNGVHLSGVSNVVIDQVISYTNGKNYDPGGTGTGDGLCLTNTTGIKVFKAVCYDNSRMGVTVTSYNAQTTALDNSLSVDNYVSNADCYNNAYLDFDFEGTSKFRSENLFGNASVSISNSKNVNISNVRLKYLYGSSTESISLSNIELRPTGVVSNVFFLEGKDITVKNVYVFDTASSYSSNTVELVGTDATLRVENLIVEKGNNAIKMTGVAHLKDVKVLNASNIPMQIDGRRIPVASYSSLLVTGGIMNAWLNKQPGTGFGFDAGTNKAGDIVYNTAPSTGTPLGWTCTVGGTPGVWEVIGYVGGVEKVVALPVASSSYRGRMMRIEGGSNVADGVYICVKKSDNSYSWTQIA